MRPLAPPPLLRLAAALLLAVCGCATHAKRVELSRTAFFANDVALSRTHLEKIADGYRGDRDCAELDLAIIDMAEGDAASAERRLRNVRDRFDALEEKSLAEAAGSYLTDDRVRAYAGEDYERILIRGMLSLCSLMRDGLDAESYSLQLDAKQHSLYQAAAQRLSPEKLPQYPVMPFGYYLRGMLREATFHDYDEAVQNYARVCELRPNVKAFAWDFDRARQGVHSQKGMGVLYVFAAVGRGPRKVAVSEEPTSDALLIADRIVSMVGPYSVPPTIAAIQIPAIEAVPPSVDRVFLRVDGSNIGPTEIIADIEGQAVGAFELNRDQVLARAVARRVIKKATVVAAKDSLQVDPLVSLAMDAAGVAWEATEAPDTRCWGLLPRHIQVLRVELPAGTHVAELLPARSGLRAGPPVRHTVEIVDGANTYLFGNFPDGKLVGRITTNRDAPPAIAAP